MLARAGGWEVSKIATHVYRVSDGDRELLVVAQEFSEAIECWRRWSALMDGDNFDLDDQPESVERLSCDSVVVDREVMATWHLRDGKFMTPSRDRWDLGGCL